MKHRRVFKNPDGYKNRPTASSGLTNKNNFNRTRMTRIILIYADLFRDHLFDLRHQRSNKIIYGNYS
jgi:hypothetical protein